MNIRPLADRILIRRLEAQNEVRGGITPDGFFAVMGGPSAEGSAPGLYDYSVEIGCAANPACATGSDSASSIDWSWFGE